MPDSVFEWMGKELFKIPEADAQRLVQDNNGNTPLHYAIKIGNSIAAELLTRRCLESEDQFELSVANNLGETILDLLASHDTPNKILELLWKKMTGVMYSARILYGIRKAEIKETTSSLSVVAGLLATMTATMTFAAAFQVPGGFDGDNGNPVLLKRAAFQIFLVSDAIAMCGSMIVLFSLLWTMGSRKRHNSLVLLDLAITLLRVSFYATLVAFMTGIYAATAHTTLWLAILVIALCSIVIRITGRCPILFLTIYIRLGIYMLLRSKKFSLKMENMF